LAKESICLCAISSRRAVYYITLAEQRSAIEVGIKKLHVVYAANDNFTGAPAPGALWFLRHCRVTCKAWLLSGNLNP